ncbi:sphingomyelin synthase family protein [Hymenobacter aerilatus]|uniref:Sphingomyelin synthase family protein n=1 Tax=Hymenobacter aerilatus TaxID=2932251 RepID=A0A8T9SUU3_9BACT|nr:sphingomyelin synthase family protein [Hymenobacter aerilatus]UOR05141.1 sphingomyelin synthase family protein [Hymenobacter aerilatus]
MPTHRSSAATTPARPLTWSAARTHPAFRQRLLVALLLLLGISYALPAFFTFVQARPGTVLPDPLLEALPAHDVSAPTFGVIYLSIAVALIYLLPRPTLLLRALWAYALLHLLRIATLWLFPLEAPAHLLVLHDPLVERFFYASQVPITKDLFFSGHTATLALLSLAVGPGRLRQVLAALTGVVAALVLVQHAHYTYDVLAAIPFAFGSYWLAGKGVSL